MREYNVLCLLLVKWCSVAYLLDYLQINLCLLCLSRTPLNYFSEFFSEGVYPNPMNLPCICPWYSHSTECSQNEYRKLMSSNNRKGKFEETKVPRSEYSSEQKFQGTKVSGPFCTGERKFQGVKRSGSESSRDSLQRANGPVSEKVVNRLFCI